MSWTRNVWTRCVSIHFIFSKVSIVDFNGPCRRDIWLCPIILWVQGCSATDVGINGCIVPFWLLGAHFLNLTAAWFDQWWIWWCYFSSVVASEDISRRNVSVEWFCLICCNISITQPISRFAFWKFRFGAFRFIIYSEVLIEDSNGRWDIHLFCHSLGSQLGLVLRLVKVLLEYGLSGHAARDCRLGPGWFRDGSDGAILLLRLLPRVGCVEKAWNDRFVATLVWSYSPALEAVELAPLVRRVPRWRGLRHFHQAVYLPTLSSQWS